jgi:hypothetical protein
MTDNAAGGQRLPGTLPTATGIHLYHIFEIGQLHVNTVTMTHSGARASRPRAGCHTGGVELDDSQLHYRDNPCTDLWNVIISLPKRITLKAACMHFIGLTCATIPTRRSKHGGRGEEVKAAIAEAKKWSSNWARE